MAAPAAEASSIVITRANVLGCYRSLLRYAAQMPSQNRKDWIARKTRKEFRAHAAETDPEKIVMYRRMALTQTETAQVQVESLKQEMEQELAMMEKKKGLSSEREVLPDSLF